MACATRPEGTETHPEACETPPDGTETPFGQHASHSDKRDARDNRGTLNGQNFGLWDTTDTPDEWHISGRGTADSLPLGLNIFDDFINIDFNVRIRFGESSFTIGEEK